MNNNSSLFKKNKVESNTRIRARAVFLQFTTEMGSLDDFKGLFSIFVLSKKIKNLRFYHIFDVTNNKKKYVYVILGSTRSPFDFLNPEAFFSPLCNENKYKLVSGSSMTIDRAIAWSYSLEEKYEKQNQVFWGERTVDIVEIIENTK